VQALRGDPHVERVGGDEALGEEARIRVDALEAERVPAHVLDPAGDRDVDGAECDVAGDRGHRRHRAGAHPIDRIAGDRLRQAGEDRGGAADRQALVADLRRRGDRDVLDLVLREFGVPLEQPDDRLDDEVVGSRAPVLALLACPSERGASPVDEDDFGAFGHDASRHAG